MNALPLLLLLAPLIPGNCFAGQIRLSTPTQFPSDFKDKLNNIDTPNSIAAGEENRFTVDSRLHEALGQAT